MKKLIILSTLMICIFAFTSFVNKEKHPMKTINTKNKFGCACTLVFHNQTAYNINNIELNENGVIWTGSAHGGDDWTSGLFTGCGLSLALSFTIPHTGPFSYNWKCTNGTSSTCSHSTGNHTVTVIVTTTGPGTYNFYLSAGSQCLN